jgi:hypothetical protein
MAPPKTFPGLRASASFQKLSAPHQQLLLDYCESGKPDDPKRREYDAIMVAQSLAVVDETVRETYLRALAPTADDADCSRRMPRLIGMTGTASWERPVVNGAPAAGAAVAEFQRRLTQVFILLADFERQARGSEVKALRTNTVEWFIFAGLPIEWETGGGGVLGVYDRTKHRMVLHHESLLKIRPDGIGDRRETLRKLAHEVNHACRRAWPEEGDATTLVDELYAYVTELIVVGNVVTEAQIAETFETLSGPPYNLKKVINSEVGKSYRAAIKYQRPDLPSQSNPVAFPLPSPGAPSAGWQHTNAVPGL